MDEEEIVRLCATMTLKDNKGSVRRLHEELKVAGIKMLATSLVGKVLTKKHVNRDAFMNVIRKIWRTKDEVDNGELGAGLTKFLRVRVGIEIDKPFRRCLRIDVLEDGVGIGKDRLFLGDKSGFKVAGRKDADTSLLRSQESMDSGNFVFNSRWEVNYLPMDQIGRGLVGGKGLGQDGSLGLIPIMLQESVKIDNSLPKKMNLGLDDVSQVTKSGTKRDEKIGPLVNSDPISNPEKRLSKEKVLKSSNVSNAAELRVSSGGWKRKLEIKIRTVIK
ncbi:hypothetical protein EZV62_008408 [Acer yangbiense]|uniref:Uncharacterized protein n=1 Tax=Acer yangbiense TaxID=1000413 RepID=A0A5C7ICS8_9ROSI|nr:hypothetical protein EZV62_008408 [Acer yangbiense]